MMFFEFRMQQKRKNNFFTTKQQATCKIARLFFEVEEHMLR